MAMVFATVSFSGCSSAVTGDNLLFQCTDVRRAQFPR
jgi:hypothetical protein